MHNWCTNKNLTGETCFSSSSCILTIHLLFFCCFQIWFKFTFSPFLKVWILFIFFFLLLPLEPESQQNWGANTENSLVWLEGVNVFHQNTSWFLIGSVYSMTLWEWRRCWWRRGRSIWVLIKREFISPPRSPLATKRSIYKSNRLFASQSPVIYDLAPLTRPASFHFC